MLGARDPRAEGGLNTQRGYTRGRVNIRGRYCARGEEHGVHDRRGR